MLINSSDEPCHISLSQEQCLGGDGINPQYYFVLYAIQNFHDWIGQVLDAIRQAQTAFAMQSTNFITTFTPTQLPPVWIDH